MGNQWSTRWDGHTRRCTVEESLRLPAMLLADGLRLIADGAERCTATVAWSEHGTIYATIGVIVTRGWEGPQVDVSYNGTHRSGHALLRSELLITTVSRMPYGGRRWWWLCPLCDRRVAVVYLPNGGQWFTCRLCHRLTYMSCIEHRQSVASFRSLGLNPEHAMRALRGVARWQRSLAVTWTSHHQALTNRRYVGR